MTTPKYILKLLDRRARLARELNSTDALLQDWLEKNGVSVEDYDKYMGCEMLTDPISSKNRIIKAINNTKNNKERK